MLVLRVLAINAFSFGVDALIGFSKVENPFYKLKESHRSRVYVACFRPAPLVLTCLPFAIHISILCLLQSPLRPFEINFGRIHLVPSQLSNLRLLVELL